MVKKETLLLLAGLVWGAAGFNILRIGLLAYPGHVTLWNLALSALVFGLFQGKMCIRDSFLPARPTDRSSRPAWSSWRPFTGVCRSSAGASPF